MRGFGFGEGSCRACGHALPAIGAYRMLVVHADNAGATAAIKPLLTADSAPTVWTSLHMVSHRRHTNAFVQIPPYCR
ncbi:MAG: hypothetical protein MZV63_33305 [Marinilabiliales bacterium]|nr:hypothetical protein [Marinilabiliales bacterium]